MRVATIANQQDSKKTSKKKKAKSDLTFTDLFLCAVAGALLGLAAPGVNLSGLAWFGLAPLLLFIARSKSFWQTVARATFFGTAYSLTYLNWYFGLCPLDWMGFAGWPGYVLAGSGWLSVSIHQGLMVACFALLVRYLPISSTLVPGKVGGKWSLPALFTIPLLWVLVENKILNHPDILGHPWIMLEYTQYKHLALIQSASIIGGIGIGFLIVMINTSAAILYATFSGKTAYKSLAAPSRRSAVGQSAVALVVLIGCVVVGIWQGITCNIQPTQTVSIIQDNVNIMMQKSNERLDNYSLLARLTELINKAPQGLIVTAESSVPTYLCRSMFPMRYLQQLALSKNSDLVVGAMDMDSKNNPYNGAYGFKRDGYRIPKAYRKQFLVPFGEYTPTIITLFPKEVRALTNTPAGKRGFSSGKSPNIMKFASGQVAPLICFECISPEIVSTSTRAGGQLLVNISDLAWFHDSCVGDQMLAFAVFRAIENRRWMVFSANTGPSAIIDPHGKIVKRSPMDTRYVLTGRVGLSSEITPFVRWFR
jgi:apolipoprotein N-acyltransferase